MGILQADHPEQADKRCLFAASWVLGCCDCSLLTALAVGCAENQPRAWGTPRPIASVKVGVLSSLPSMEMGL